MDWFLYDNSLRNERVKLRKSFLMTRPLSGHIKVGPMFKVSLQKPTDQI